MLRYVIARAQTQTATLDLGKTGQGTLVVVADSHSRVHPNARRWIQREKPQAILHAGDIGDLDVLDELAEIAPVHAVRGNIDGRDARTPDHLVIDVASGADCRLRLLLTHIAVYGPRLLKDARERALRLGAQLVVCGHSHVPLIAADKELEIFNPGSLGPRRFHLPIVFGVMTFAPAGVRLRHVDCETGSDWLPPALSARGADPRL